MGGRLGLALVWLMAGQCSGFRKQAYAVTGRLRCGEAPPPPATVRLLDFDTGCPVASPAGLVGGGQGLGGDADPDDLLGAAVVTNGSFALSGHTRELSDIEPYLELTSACGLTKPVTNFILPNSFLRLPCTFQNCVRVLIFDLPKSYINKGPLNFGTFNLEVAYRSAAVQCTNE